MKKGCLFFVCKPGFAVRIVFTTEAKGLRYGAAVRFKCHKDFIAMKRTFFICWVQALAALAVTEVSSAYAGEYDSGATDVSGGVCSTLSSGLDSDGQLSYGEGALDIGGGSQNSGDLIVGGGSQNSGGSIVGGDSLNGGGSIVGGDSLNGGGLIIGGNPIVGGGSLNISGGTINLGGGAININLTVDAGKLQISSGPIKVRELLMRGGSITFAESVKNIDIETFKLEGVSADLGSMFGGNTFYVGTLSVDNSTVEMSRNAQLNENFGNLIVKNDSVLKSNGITMSESAGSTLQLINGSLSQAGYNVDVCAGNTFSSEGENYLTAERLIMAEGSTLELAVSVVNGMDGAAVLTTAGELSMDAIELNLLGTEHLEDGEYKLLTSTDGSNLDISGWTINGATSDQLKWKDGTLYYVGGYEWNHGVTKAEDIDDLREILGNLVVNGGDITLEAIVKVIQDAVGDATGHVVINRGGIHITGAGALDGHIIFNGNLKEIRKLFIEKDFTNVKIELGGGSENENIVDVCADKTAEVTSISGEGGMNKTGEGEMILLGNGHEVGGTMAVEEGKMTFAGEGDAVEAAAEGDAGENATKIHELVVGRDGEKEIEMNVAESAVVEGFRMHVNGSQTTVTNEGSLKFSAEVLVTNGHLDNQGSISRVLMSGGKLSGSGVYDGVEMSGGVLVVGNSPGLQTYTSYAVLDKGDIVFSVADTETAATADTKGWGSDAYSTINMEGNKLTLGEDVSFVLEIGGEALEMLVAQEGATLTFNLELIQNINAESLVLSEADFTRLLDNTRVVITSDYEGLSESLLYLAGKDITYMLSGAGYGYVDDNLVFHGTLTNTGFGNVPEPATATLSLLALTALVMRRRRSA